MIKRILERKLIDRIYKGKALIVVGPRQSGKTTLIRNILKNYKTEEIRFFNCENPTERESLNDKDFENVDKIIGKAKIVFIDEGQKVKTIGQTLKLLVDEYKETKQIFVTGSSSFNLLNNTEEPLTGRKLVYKLYPFSIGEILGEINELDLSKQVEDILIYGLYPEVYLEKNIEDKQKFLQELASSNLYKDILEFQQLRDSSILNRLLVLLALQIGSEVSLSELSSKLGVDYKTVERYIDLLEKNYVIFRLAPYAIKKRRTINKMNKLFFYDLGIRNAIINNFNPLYLRGDVGGLWENFLVLERMKFREYNFVSSNQYFWKTYDGSEVDLVEEREGKLSGYEFKYSKSNSNAPKSFLSDHDNATWELINSSNWVRFVTNK